MPSSSFDWCGISGIGAQGETRTRTSVRTRRPERRASTNSATWALRGRRPNVLTAPKPVNELANLSFNSFRAVKMHTHDLTISSY